VVEGHDLKGLIERERGERERRETTGYEFFEREVDLAGVPNPTRLI